MARGKNSNKMPVPPGLKLRHTLSGGSHHLHRLAWSPNGEILASASSSSAEDIQLWNVISGQLIRTLKGHRSDVLDLAWSPDGEMLASESTDQTVRVWHRVGPRESLTLEHSSSLFSIAWSPNGDILAAGAEDGNIVVFDTKTWESRQILIGHKSVVISLVWSPDGQTLASGSEDGTIRLWGAESGKLLAVLEGHSGPVYGVTWALDGRMVASGSADDTVRLWDVRSGRQVNVLEGHTDGVISVSFGFDDQILTSSSITGTTLFWSTETLAVVAQLTEEPVECNYSGIKFHPTLPILATPSGGEIHIWDVRITDLLGANVSDSETIHYTNAKVVLVGDSGVGKSGLGLVLTGESFLPTESTHGRHVWTLDKFETPTNTKGVRETREVLLWDLAGQPGYRVIHQLHLLDVAVAIVVFDARSETDPFAGVHYWDRALRQADFLQGRSAHPLKKLLVEARSDRGGLNVSADRINALVKSLGFEKHIRTSAKEGWGIAELRDAIRQAIDWTALPTISSTSLFLEIKSFLVAEKEAGRILSVIDDLYRAYLGQTKRDVTEGLRDQFETCIGRVEAGGLIQRLNFGDLILLQPELLDGYAASIVSAARDEPDGLGYINENAAQTGRFRMSEDQRIKDRGQETLLLISTVENLLRHEIALREPSEQGTCLVFPSQLTRENPDLPEPEGKAVVFEFEGPVFNIYATLIVRLSRSGIFQRREMWKNAVTFSQAKKGIFGVFLRELQEGRGELTLFFDSEAGPDSRLQFQDYIYAHLQRRAIPASIKMRRIFVCPNPTCRTPVADIVARRRIERGYFTMQCPVCDTEISLSLREELPGVDSSFLQLIDRSADVKRERETATSILQGKIEVRDFDVLFFCTDLDRPAVRKIGELLKERGILPWFDEWETAPGSLWQAVLERDFKQIRAAIVFIGNTEQEVEVSVEKSTYLRQFIKAGRPVIPVILERRRKARLLPDFLQGMAVVDFTKTRPDPLIELISLITQTRHPGTSSATVRMSEPDQSANDTTRETLERKRDDAIKREDWSAARQHLLELAQISSNQPDESGAFAFSALMIADDPQKLNGKGLKDPLEILARTNIGFLELAIPSCHHRKSVLSELRSISRSGQEGILPLLKRVGVSSWNDWFSSSSPDTSEIDYLPREGQGFPAIRLLRLRLENIKNFDSLHLDLRDEQGLPSRCTAIVGDNATGKTTLLQSIALVCLGPSLANQDPLRARSLLRDGAENGTIELEFEFAVDSDATEEERSSISVGLEIVRKEATCRPLAHTRMEFSNFNHAEHWNALRNKLDFNFGLCCGYGAFRALREKNEGLLALSTRAEVDHVFSLFQPQSSLMDPETLQAILRTDVSNISKERQNIPLGIRDDIMKMFSEIIPGIEIKQQDGEPELVEKWGGVKALAVLSDGYNSMAGLLGHLIRHTLEILGWLKKSDDKVHGDSLVNPLEAVGIILIDEVDLHLHPVWQRHILSKLQSAFPNFQFIVTTHSPLVLGGTPDVRVFVLKRNEESKIEVLTDLPSVRGWRVDQLLTGLPFELSSAYDPQTERLSIKYGKLLNDLGPEHEDVIALEKELDELNFLGPGSTKLDRNAWALLNEFADYRLAKMTSDEREQTLAKIWTMLRS
jgi:WD40 repeat protein